MGGWYSDAALEDLLESYPVIKAQAAIEAEELKHLFPSCTTACDGQPRGGEVPDGTGAYAVRREERSKNTRRAKAVEIACEALSAQERELVRLMYFERWGGHHISLHMGVRRSRLFGIRRSALDKLAEILL
jgi:DNA-directed RNA polymerase specialized sigma subunit